MTSTNQGIHSFANNSFFPLTFKSNEFYHKMVSPTDYYSASCVYLWVVSILYIIVSVLGAMLTDSRRWCLSGQSKTIFLIACLWWMTWGWLPGPFEAGRAMCCRSDVNICWLLRTSTWLLHSSKYPSYNSSSLIQCFAVTTYPKTQTWCFWSLQKSGFQQYSLCPWNLCFQ